MPPATALAHLPAQAVQDDAEQEDVWQGRSLPTELADTGVVRVLDTDGALLGLARAEAGRLLPFKVFRSD